MKCNLVRIYLRRIARYAILIVAWTGVHHLAVNVYQYSCTPRSITGFALSAFMMSAPHCHALRWVMNAGATYVINTWTLVGTLLAGEICRDFIVKSPGRSTEQHRPGT